jgi:predicted ATPase
LIEDAIEWWGKAGQQSLERSALVEAAEQLTRALNQIAMLPATPALLHKEINLQVALIPALIHVKGYAAPESKAAEERARLLIEQAEALGAPPEDPLLLFSVLYSVWAANFVAFNGDAIRKLSAQFLTLATKQKATGPLAIGHRLLATSLLHTGDIADCRAHFDQAIALYEPVEHRPLAIRFGQDVGVSILSFRSLALWILGYPEAALTDTNHAVGHAREIGQAAGMMYALNVASLIHILCGNHVTANTHCEELVALADEKGSAFWKAFGMLPQGYLVALTRKASDAFRLITSGITAFRSTGATMWLPLYMSQLAGVYAELSQFDDAARCVGEAMTVAETTKELWCDAEINRVAGEIARKSSEAGPRKAEGYFERALAVGRQQQAKSWELRAAVSLSRLWRDQGKVSEARELLAPVYGWFTEGFDTRDLKEAKALLEELAG